MFLDPGCSKSTCGNGQGMTASSRKGSGNQQQQQRKDAVEKLMEEISEELGVNSGTRSVDEAPSTFAKRLKKAIRKRI
ncbi:hypothetical protein [Pasteuria penetrans]|uniref:hypothetical protein n=1 Tax=Pasteuria penetrans TaxID=86005 RepID=UPI000FB48C9B|nr:hypothetical protein [Pasteuria penetrans]